MPRRTIRMVTVGALLCLLSTCGIPSIGYLYSPSIVRSTLELATATFGHPVGNSTDNFSGYEFYYKFYVASTGSGEYDSDRGEIIAAPPGAAVSRAEALEYRRIVPTDDADDRALPLMDVAEEIAVEPFEFTVSFPVTPFTGESAILSWSTSQGDSELALGRPLSGNDAAGGVEAFQPEEINAGDVDVPENLADEENRILLGLIVFAYGIDYAAGLTPLYSQPQMLNSPLTLTWVPQ